MSNELSQDDVARLLRHCQLFTGRRWDGSELHLIEAARRHEELVDVLQAYAAWLERLEAEARRRGLPWTTETLIQPDAEEANQ